MTRALALALALLLVAPRARAEGDATPSGLRVDLLQSQTAEGGGVAVTPIAAGQAAPHAGLLLSDETFLAYLRQQVALEEALLRIEARDRLIKEADARAERGFFERHGFVIGLAAGALISFLVVQQATTILERR